jgi:hypothetical protein
MQFVIMGTGYSKDIGFKTGALFLSCPLFLKLISFQNINAYYLDPYPHHANALVMSMA